MTDWPARTLITNRGAYDAPFDFVTHKFSDELYEGGWSLIKDPIVIFSDHNMDGTTMSHHGGPIGGTAGGVPVQLIFWDGWWNGAGAVARGAVESQVQRMLVSRYFTQLTQYGVPHAPVWRGSITVTKPGAPMSASTNDTMSKVLDLIDDLIDDDVFPDPDDGPRIAFIVIYPPWFSVSDADAPLGAHYYDYDYNFPFDVDNYWGGWVRYRDSLSGPADGTVRTLGHELIEIVTDPEADGWHTEMNTGTNELVDAGASPAAGLTPYTSNATKQTAFTDGVELQAYWSNAHNRTVIPLNDDLHARMVATLEERSRTRTQEGTFRPGSGGLSFCIDDRDYWWRVYSVDEHVSVTVQAAGFHTPAASAWTLNGTPAPGPVGVLALPVTVSTYVGRKRVDQAATAQVGYSISSLGMELDVSGAGGSFDLVVGCHVKDMAITGNVLSQPDATPHVYVGVRGVELQEDPSYTSQLDHCLGVFTKRWQEQADPLGRPRPGDPPVFNPGELRRAMPAFAPQAEWVRARAVARAITAAYSLMPLEEARLYAAGVLQGLPSIGDQVSLEHVEHTLLARSGDSEEPREPEPPAAAF